VTKRLVKNSKLTNRQLNQLIQYFALEVPASRAARAMNINRHTAQRIYQVIPRCLARGCELESPFGGEVECDESYFGGRRKGPRGRVAAGKVPVFGLLKRNGIENFWGYAKTKLKSYYGVSREHFYFYLKEMEFRFNHRKAANLAALIKKTVRKHQAVLD
jgi:transposase-like protein